MPEPLISCLCPSYRRPRLLENAIACFEAQTWPNKELLILEDSGDVPHQRGKDWQLVSSPVRFNSLPAKFHALAGLARGEFLVVLEDDDIYLPLHLEAHADTLERATWSKPGKVFSLYPGHLAEEPAAGRFHASIAMTRKTYEESHGWPLTKSASFDQLLLRRLEATGPAGDTMQFYPKTYVFRWQSTNKYHGQAYMKSPDCTEWYDRIPEVAAKEGGGGVDIWLDPRFDQETLDVYRKLGFQQGV